MTPRGLKFSAIAGLGAAIALVALSLTSGMQASAITGPEALGVTPQGEVWIGVDKQLWRASADGHLLHADAARDLGLSGPPSGLVRHPDGHMVATVRDDPTLYVLDPVTAHVVSTIKPGWPADLKTRGQDAINVAFAPDGRIAIATGGGHTVALFDANGTFLTRTAPDTYRFTNGLWWHGQDLWTTDTNRFALRRLDGKTLAVQQSVSLPVGDPAMFLGPARAASADDPTAALIRYRNGMISGRVVIARPDGTETPLATHLPSEPTDVDWLVDRVIASDGAAMAVHRWTNDGSALSDFGDDAFARRLADVTATRAGLERRHAWTLRAGIAVFALAFALAFAAQRAQERLGPAGGGAALDLSHLGTPRVGAAGLAWLTLRLVWPVAALAFVSQLPRLPELRAALLAASPREPMVRVVVFVAFTIAWLIVAMLIVRSIQRKGREPAFEPMFNATAVRRLREIGTAQLPLAAGEHVVETFLLQRHESGDRGLPWRVATGLRWVAVTNQSIRVFGSPGPSQWLDMEFGLGDIAVVATQPPEFSGFKRFSAAWIAFRNNRGGWLSITLADGRVVQGAMSAPSVLERLVPFLAGQHAGVRSERRADALPAHARAATGPARGQAALASFLLPGLGQWWQRRPAVGLLLFVPWAVLLLSRTIPILWTAIGVRAEVSANTIVVALALHVVYALLASLDAWQMGRPGHVGKPVGS